MGEKKAKWHTEIRTMPHAQGFSFPMLEFRWGIKKLTGGTVRLWPQKRTIVAEVKINRDTEKTGSLVGNFFKVKSAVAAIKENFGSLPPNFSEAFKIVRYVRSRYKGKVDGPEVAQKLFDKIRAKWQSLIGNG